MNKISRRKFLQISGFAAGATMLPLPMKWLGRRDVFAFYQTPANQLGLFKTKLRGVGPAGIPLATPDGSAGIGGAAHYTFNIGQFTDQLHPALGPTTLWGYNPQNALGVTGVPAQKHLGGIIVANKGVPIQLTFTNNLPNKHILPVDKSANFPDAAQHVNDASVHLHGGFVPWISDGGPMAYFGPPTIANPNGVYGPSVSDGVNPNLFQQVLNSNLDPGQAEYYYPNQQSARMMWYHDHTHDCTRLNAYAGLASVYLIRDTFEGNLRNLGLPDYIENGGFEIPLVIQDKIFVGSNIGLYDPTWPGPRTPGSLWYPHIYEKNRWHKVYSPLRMPAPSAVPEMFGDTMLVNGTVFPEATVEARPYRLRILNVCNARFMNLQLYVDDGSLNGVTLNPVTGNPPPSAAFVDGTQNQPAVLQLGTEGGFLPTPVLVPTNVPFGFDPVTGAPTGSILMGPAERVDLIVDFKNYIGKNVILYSDAPAPFPLGDPRNDYFPQWNTAGNPANALTKNGFGPNTRVLMRFKVKAATSSVAAVSINTATDLSAGNDPLPLPGGAPIIGGALQLPPGVPVRPLTLNEVFDSYGRLLQLLGTNVPTANAFGLGYMDNATEVVNLVNGEKVEIWQIANLTGDTHPIHFHLVNAQLLGRQPFDVVHYNGTPTYIGPARGPDPNETGFKETIRMNPGEVTTVIMRFKFPTVPFTVPNSLNPNLGISGKEYVWHCHILDHEEHDMMRPLVVI
ncbi:multicopper oxidase type 2 [Geobacter metallireducens RCH3]|uniref:Multicopper oxidase, putative n=1 Tax=Geobacter metallireducens (strain ATCC 53774 / DSM 7210 / GS-15) TaxID=269799 RepID=Q39SH2_GEOMG|nr:multicopper oxidase domain-containing protein [Geobacter metallireducens]ABB32802.1 multicopper oxidase, putative [Geobacter metallireducens GS-15]EHP86088.1 multicopper oxidase type 2 [Geobacter metallireducens RCH3]